MKTGLNGKTVVITGASGGIGRACARQFANEGAKLVLHGLSQIDALRAFADELDADSLVMSADLTNETDVQALFDQSLNHFGQIDVLVANAGIWVSDDVPLAQMTLTQWERTIAVDQTSVFLCARAFFQSIEQSKPKAPSLIIVGSSAAIFGEAFHGDYAAAKAAITYGLTRTLKNEIVRIAPKGRVNAVCPGWTQTPMAESAMNDQAAYRRAMQTRAIPVIAQPKDVAPVIVFLSSSKLSGQITGEVITVAGGMEGRVLHEF